MNSWDPMAWICLDWDYVQYFQSKPYREEEQISNSLAIAMAWQVWTYNYFDKYGLLSNCIVCNYKGIFERTLYDFISNQ